MFERLGNFASREVMKKDANNELLKCVSEFMENTIDWLLADPKLASVVAPMFTITLTRLAKCVIFPSSLWAVDELYVLLVVVVPKDC